MKNSKIKTITSFIIVIIFILGLVAYGKHYRGEPLPLSIKKSEPEKVSKCGLTVYEPVSGSGVGPHFVISSVVDNNERDSIGCGWVVFEAQAGVVYVKDGQGRDIAKPTPLTTVMDWMTDDPVIYSANIEILNDYKGKALVIINEESPSDEDLPKTLTFPLIIK